MQIIHICMPGELCQDTQAAAPNGGSGVNSAFWQSVPAGGIPNLLWPDLQSMHESIEIMFVLGCSSQPPGQAAL
jgi:hypothetical protein